ncbi:MAG: hypothetical protein ACM3ST_09740 [Bdellovibrio bacteriovorus]
MPLIPPASPLSALLVLSLGLSALAGCNGSPTPGAAGPGGATSQGADPGRQVFVAMALPESGTVGADPVSLARGLFGAQEPMEGPYTEDVEILAESAQGKVVLFTQMELPDDSVRGRRHRLEFQPQDGEWALTWVGWQVRCRPGRGHEDWGLEPCL